MALTVEDGTGVAGADSYVSLAQARSYALSHGLSLPTDDQSLEVLLRNATQYLETRYRSRFKGSWLKGPGYLQWPRSSVVLDGFDVAETSIPQLLKDVQCQTAFELQTTDPLRTVDGTVVKREKVDVVETEYAVNPGALPPIPTLRKVDLMIRPLCNSLGVTLIRV